MDTDKLTQYKIEREVINTAIRNLCVELYNKFPEIKKISIKAKFFDIEVTDSNSTKQEFTKGYESRIKIK